MKKKFDLTVKIGATKEGKALWKNVGAVMENDKGMFIFMDRTFNPAGVPSDGTSILISMFEPKDKASSTAVPDTEDLF